MIPDRLDIAGGRELGVLGKLKITINGTEVHGVCEFCISEGWVDLYHKGQDGKYAKAHGEFVITRRIGDVEVTLDE